MKLDVPYYSQQSDVAIQEWKSRACGIVSIKMVMDFHSQKKDQSIDELIQEGTLIGGYSEHGWIHDRLVALLRNHGFLAYSQEFRSITVDIKTKEMSLGAYESEIINQGIEKIISSLDKKQPVICSVPKYFEDEKKYHVVVITGYEKNDGNTVGFYYHDPEPKPGSTGEYVYVPIGEFKEKWRKFAIFVEAHVLPTN